MKSGGETQTPFYIAVLASFAQLYRVNDATRFGNTVRLVVFDEAFNKMDSDRITESVLLLRKMGLQAIICTPPDKVSGHYAYCRPYIISGQIRIPDAYHSIWKGDAE